jgi:hypothetical protein
LSAYIVTCLYIVVKKSNTDVPEFTGSMIPTH